LTQPANQGYTAYMLITVFRELRGDRQFFTALVTIAGPIMLQNLLISSLSFVDMLMIGQLGEVEIAGVGLANQMFFLTILFFFGTGSGASIFIAQYWGNRDKPAIHKAMGVGLVTASAGAFVTAAASLFFPREILSLFTPDQAVITAGVSYLRIVSVSYIFMGISFIYSTALRSMEMAKYPLISTAIALTANTLFNYLLIFGKWGFPALGVAGAAYATTASRGIGMLIIIRIAYAKKTPAAGTLRDYFSFDRAYLKKFFMTALPVILNEVFWALGMMVYKMVYARMGTDVIASANVSESIQNLFFVIFIGTGNAAAVMIGNCIGAKQMERADIYAKRFMLLPAAGGLFIGLLMAAAAPAIPHAFNIAPEVVRITQLSLYVLAFLIPLKGLNLHIIIGILRSGGDTRFSLFLEMSGVWMIGVPMALLSGLILRMPIYFVYLMVSTEELFKAVIGIRRIRSGKWINDLTEEVPDPNTQVISAAGTEIP